MNFDLHDVLKIGGNRHGYGFFVGRLGERWIGFAASEVDGQKYMFVFPDIADGFELGLPDRDQVILRTGAIAQSVENAYGGVDVWCVPESLRGNPKDFECEYCGAVCCNGVDCGTDIEDLPDIAYQEDDDVVA